MISHSSAQLAQSALVSVSMEGPSDRFNDPTTNRFFETVANFCTQRYLNERPFVFIVVVHVVPTLPYFLRALSKMGRINGIIRKGTPPTQHVLAQIQHEYAGRIAGPEINKATLQNRAVMQRYLLNTVAEGEQCVIIDIGGYFSGIDESVMQHCRQNRREILGIVEDTKNGLIKYQEKITCIPCPVLSVAVSKVKAREDTEVGALIVKATEKLLGDEVSRGALGAKRLKDCRIGVVGIGLIGTGIVRQLIRDECVVHACDIDSVSEFLTGGMVFPLKLEDIVRNCELIFCATGNHCFTAEQWHMMPDNVYIASCTSADDEFGSSLIHLKGRASITNPSEHIEQISVSNPDGTTKHINLLAKGGPVNFTLHGDIGPCVYAVQALLMTCAARLMGGEVKRQAVVQAYDEGDQKEIAGFWNKIFKMKPILIESICERQSREDDSPSLELSLVLANLVSEQSVLRDRLDYLKSRALKIPHLINDLSRKDLVIYAEWKVDLWPAGLYLPDHGMGILMLGPGKSRIRWGELASGELCCEYQGEPFNQVELSNTKISNGLAFNHGRFEIKRNDPSLGSFFVMYRKDSNNHSFASVKIKLAYNMLPENIVQRMLLEGELAYMDQVVGMYMERMNSLGKIISETLEKLRGLSPTLKALPSPSNALPTPKTASGQSQVGVFFGAPANEPYTSAFTEMELLKAIHDIKNIMDSSDNLVDKKKKAVEEISFTLEEVVKDLDQLAFFESEVTRRFKDGLNQSRTVMGKFLLSSHSWGVVTKLFDTRRADLEAHYAACSTKRH